MSVSACLQSAFTDSTDTTLPAVLLTSPEPSSVPRLFPGPFGARVPRLYFTGVRVSGCATTGADASPHIFAYGGEEIRGDISQLKCVLSKARRRRRNRDAAPLQARVDRRPTTHLHIRHQFYSLLTVSGHPCAGKLLNHPRIRTKASLVTAPLSIRASFLLFFFCQPSTAETRRLCCYKQGKRNLKERKMQRENAMMRYPKRTRKKRRFYNTDLKIAHRHSSGVEQRK